MMPPDRVTPIPSDSRVIPDPGYSLTLGGGRWLHQTGEVTTTEPSRECDITAETLAYWEDAAVRGGNTLNDLIV